MNYAIKKTLVAATALMLLSGSQAMANCDVTCTLKSSSMTLIYLTGSTNEAFALLAPKNGGVCALECRNSAGQLLSSPVEEYNQGDLAALGGLQGACSTFQNGTETQMEQQCSAGGLFNSSGTGSNPGGAGGSGTGAAGSTAGATSGTSGSTAGAAGSAAD